MSSVYPLGITALAGWGLGEFFGPRRWAAVAVGFVGGVVILRPGLGVFDPAALLALAGAGLFSVYQILNKVIARHDGMTTILLYTGWVGFALTSIAGLFYWEPPDLQGWLMLLVAGVFGVIGHKLGSAHV